jgi:hypothetical protein
MAEHPVHPRRHDWIHIGIPAVLAGGFVILTWLLTGLSLAVFFSGILAATLLIPSVSQRPLGAHLLCAAGILDAVGIIWLASLVQPEITFWTWLNCYLLLIAWGMMLLALSRLFRAIPLFSASAIVWTIGLGLLWLSSPVWLSDVLVQHPRWITPLVHTHPLLSLNGQLIELGFWTHRPLAYQVLSLGQDVPYTLPPRVWPAIVGYASITLGLGLATQGLNRYAAARETARLAVPAADR